MGFIITFSYIIVNELCFYLPSSLSTLSYPLLFHFAGSLPPGQIVPPFDFYITCVPLPLTLPSPKPCSPPQVSFLLL